MLSQEGRRWVVTLAGYADDAPPLTMAAFVLRAQSMVSHELAATVRDARALCDPLGY